MAKMFIKADEARQELGVDEEQLKQFVREGRLREFRDGPTVMYKKEQIDQLAADAGGGGGAAGDSGGDELDLDDSMGDSIGLADSGNASGSIDMADSGGDRADDSGESIGLSDSHGDGDIGLSGSIPTTNDDSIGLSDTGGVAGLADTGESFHDAGGSGGDDIGISDTGAGIGLSPDDTAADVGLSGSLGGVRGPDDDDPSAGSSGITVLDDTGDTDPMAQTAVGSGVSGQVAMDQTGSGSGLLDLTRENDDTSLGADVLDDLGPGGTGFGSSAVTPATSGMNTGMGTNMGTGMGTSMGTHMGTGVAPAIAGGSAPVAGAYATAAPDPVATGLGAAALAASLVALVGLIAVAGLATGVLPSVLEVAETGVGPFITVAAVGVILAIIFFVVGALLGKR